MLSVSRPFHTHTLIFLNIVFLIRYRPFLDDSLSFLRAPLFEMSCSRHDRGQWINICSDLSCWVGLCLSYLLSRPLGHLCFISLDLDLPREPQASSAERAPQPVHRLVSSPRFLWLEKMNGAGSISPGDLY